MPDLVVEVLSKSNTPKEMNRKLGEYFRAGVRLVWYVDPSKRTVRVSAGDRPLDLLDATTSLLDGGDVLPGFTLSIRDWFAEAERDGPRVGDDEPILRQEGSIGSSRNRSIAHRSTSPWCRVLTVSRTPSSIGRPTSSRVASCSSAPAQATVWRFV